MAGKVSLSWSSTRRGLVSVEPRAAASSHRSASAIRPTSCRVDALTRDSRGLLSPSRAGGLFNLVADPAFLAVAWDRRGMATPTCGAVTAVPRCAGPVTPGCSGASHSLCREPGPRRGDVNAAVAVCRLDRRRRRPRAFRRRAAWAQWRRQPPVPPQPPPSRCLVLASVQVHGERREHGDEYP